MGQVVTILKDPEAVTFLDAELWADHHADRSAARDPFARAVPDAGIDICSLHNSQPAPSAEWLLCLLAAFGRMGRTVTTASLVGDRIEMTVDGVRIAAGQAGRRDMQAQDFYRPQLPHASRKAAMLGYYLSRHAAVCRLRIDQHADAEVTRDICALFMQYHGPIAVILNPDRLVLTRAEFTATTPDTLCQLHRGKRLAPHTQRHDRPRMDQIAGAQSASPVAKTRAPGIFAHHRHRGTRQVPRATEEAALGKGAFVAKAFCTLRTERSLKSAFRADPAASAARMRSCDAGPAATARQAPRTPGDALLCDAIQLSARGKTLRLVAPLLMATMVLLTNLHHGGTGSDQRQSPDAFVASNAWAGPA